MREKFGQALNEPATEPGRPQEWLRAAWLRFHTVRPDDLPPGELRRLFIGIRNDLTSEEPTGIAEICCMVDSQQTRARDQSLF